MSLKKLIIVIVVILLISIISVGLYSHFNKGGNNNSNNGNNNGGKNTDNNKISSIYNLSLDENEQEISIKDKKITLKRVNNELYVNGNKVSNVKAEYAKVTEQVIIFTYKGKCKEIISYVIDSDGKSVPFTKNNYQLYDFRMLDGNCVAAGSDTCPCDPKTCAERINITFTYDGSELTIK